MSDILSAAVDLLGPEGAVPWDALPPGQQAPIQGASSGALPQAVAYPNTQEQLAALMACAHRHHWRVLPCGSGSKLAWGGLAEGLDLVVSTRRLNRLIDHAAGDLTVTAEAGLRLAELETTLATSSQLLGLDSAYGEQATLGGIVATGDVGSRRQRYGGVRDRLIGVSFVRYDGQIAKAGGRVVKNVAGYDLMKLLIGSYGTLGIVSQVTFRTYPAQESSQSVVFAGPSAAVNQLSQALRASPLTPTALDLLSPALMAALGQPREFGLAAQVQSIAAGVEEQVQRLQLLGQEAGLKAVVLRDEADAQFWQQSSYRLFGSPSDGPDSTAVLAKVGILPAAAVSLLEQLEASGSLGRLNASGSVGHLRLEGGPNANETASIVMKLRSHCQSAGGYLTLLAAPSELKQAVEVWGYSGNALAVMRQLKAQFDPPRLLSPGRFVGGI
ncbi:MAG TPA: FAD-binding oxidoreductase [Trichocoleus sp.]